MEIKNGTIHINGNPVLDSLFYQRYYYNRGDFAAEGQRIVVPPGNYFVLGDNSASSKDSRYWGFVPDKNILGRAMVIYFPLNRIRIIK